MFLPRLVKRSHVRRWRPLWYVLTVACVRVAGWLNPFLHLCTQLLVFSEYFPMGGHKWFVLFWSYFYYYFIFNYIWSPEADSKRKTLKVTWPTSPFILPISQQLLHVTLSSQDHAVDIYEAHLSVKIICPPQSFSFIFLSSDWFLTADLDQSILSNSI